MAIGKAIADALSEVDRCRSLTVDRVIEQLDLPMWQSLGKAVNGTLFHPAYGTVGQALGYSIWGPTIRSLISLGCVRAEYPKLTLEWLKENADKPEAGLVAYQATGLGRAVFEKVDRNLTGDDPAVREFINKLGSEDAGAS